MADKLYTIVNGEPSELDLGTGGSESLPGIDERVTALEESQIEQDEAIAVAQQSADAADEEAREAKTIAESKVATVNGLSPDAEGNVDVGGMPLGTAFAYTGKDVPAGTLRADGSTYSNMRASFPEFYAWVKTSGLTVALSNYTLVEGSCGFYGIDDATGTVRMPTLAAGVFGTTVAGQYGAAVQAGLPNITGTTGANDYNHYGTGAYSDSSTKNGTCYSWDGTTSAHLSNFDASRSSPVYGRSDTVTPSHVKYPWVIVVYNAATSVSVAEAAEFVGLLDGKADKSSMEAIRAYITETWSSGTEWYRKWSDGWIEQGGRADTDKVVTLNTAFTSTTYTVQVTTGWDGTNNAGAATHAPIVSNKTTTQFYCGNYNGQESDWYACGY